MIIDPKISIITHEEILNTKYLPTFNSHSIESSLHHIQGLSNNFLYFNDDFILTAPCHKSDFFTVDGRSKVNFEPYGMVYGDTIANDPEYLNAARNGRQLIEKMFHFSPSRLHEHSPYAIRKDIMYEIENIFSQSVSDTRSNKFRHIGDISVPSFLYHYYAIAIGQAIETKFPCILVQSRNNYKRIFKLLKSRAMEAKSICINDGNDSHLDQEWHNSIIDYLRSIN
jgi:hypothetical protein